MAPAILQPRYPDLQLAMLSTRTLGRLPQPRKRLSGIAKNSKECVSFVSYRIM